MKTAETVKTLCEKAAEGSLKPDYFYTRLSEIADSEDTDGDLACIIEDGLIEMEMSGAESKKAREMLMKDTARQMLAAMLKGRI